MPNKTVEILGPDNTGIRRAVELLSDGQLVAFSTETVYGLGADARNDRAVARIFEAKNRPVFNPLIVHVASKDDARQIAEINGNALRLADAFWPGPLSLVVPVRKPSRLSLLVTAGLDTVAVRLPEHPVARQLLNEFGGPLAAPSANPSGRISPTTAQHVLNGLDGQIAAIVDGGDCAVGLESTIIGFEPEPTLLRAGGIPTEVIEACLGLQLRSAPIQRTPNAPGQLASHYAPKGTLRLNAVTKEIGETHLGFGSVEGDVNLSISGDLIEAASNLFGALHELDRQDVEKIAVAPLPDHGLGRAINDRLVRAAAPRG